MGIGQHYIGVFCQHTRQISRAGGEASLFAGVGLESRAEQGDPLASDGVEHGGDHVGDEAALLVVIHLNDLFPVRRHFG